MIRILLLLLCKVELGVMFVRIGKCHFSEQEAKWLMNFETIGFEKSD